jgi:phosphoglycerate dehydrogenase-like enzyme
VTVKYTVLVSARAFRDTPGEHWAILERAGCTIRVASGPQKPDEHAMAEMMAGCDGAIVGTEPVSAKVIARAPHLRVVSRFGVGVDNIDLEAATIAGVVVTVTTGANATAVAELVLGFILGLARGIPRHDSRTKRGDWHRDVGSEISGKTLGIVGLGHIGRELATRARALGMRVLYTDVVRPSQEREAALGVSYRSLVDLLRESDFVSLHAPRTSETVGLIGPRELAAMRPSAYLINTARGELVDEAALARALAQGGLAGAALDVRAEEPSRAGDPLCLDAVILTPHIGAYTKEAINRMAVMAAENLVGVLMGERPDSVANPAVYRAGWKQSSPEK